MQRRTSWSTAGRLAAALAAAVLAACGDEAGAAATESWTFIDGPGAGVDLALDGVAIECDASVHLVYQHVSGTGEETDDVLEMNGHPFGVRDGVFFLGEREYGPAPRGARVRVTAEGVFVDGERRGDTPPPADG